MTDIELRKRLRDNIGLIYYWNKSFKTAKGYRLKGVDGHEMIDFNSGYGVANIGWGNEEVIAFQKKQVEISSYAPPWSPTEEALGLSQKLLSLFPDTKYKCVRATGGANANEIALSIFCNLTGGNIGTFKQSYHGWSQATIGISEWEKFNFPKVKDAFKSIKVAFPKETEDSLAFANKIFDDNPSIKIFIAEPIIGSGGVFFPPKNFWQVFLKVCAERGVFLILDESITGFGRIGYMTACHYYDVRPDAIIFAKGITSGYAILGACLVKEKHLENNRCADISATFSWTPYACAVTQKVIEILQRDNLCKNSLDTGLYLKNKLQQVFETHLNGKKFDLRGMGMMMGLTIFEETGEPDMFIMGRMFFYLGKKGLMITTSWDSTSLVFMPPLILDKAGCDEAVAIFEKFFAK